MPLNVPARRCILHTIILHLESLLDVFKCQTFRCVTCTGSDSANRFLTYDLLAYWRFQLEM